MEIRQHMQPAGEIEALRLAQLHDALGDRAVPRGVGSPPAPCSRTTWSSSAPVADWPPSLIQQPGRAAPK